MDLPQRTSLVPQLVEILRRDLHFGARSHRLPSERELAERFQVSRTTLRKALQLLARDGWIRAEPGQAWAVISRPKRLAALSAPRTIGILCPMPLDQAPQFLLFLLERLQERLNAVGWKVEVRGGWEYQQQHSRHVLSKMLQETRARLWVLTGSRPEVLQWFENRNVPSFCIGKPPPQFQFPYLSDDVRVACRHAVGLLVSRGHRRLAWLRLRATARAPDDALKGFQEGIELCRRRGEISARIVHHIGPPDDLQPVLRRLMESSPCPTAFLVEGARYTLTTLTCLTYTGVRVPQDVSVVSMVSQPYLDLIKPSIA